MGAIGANRFLPPWMQRNLRSYSYVNIIGKPNTSRWYEGFIPSGKFGAGYTGGAYLVMALQILLILSAYINLNTSTPQNNH